MIRICFLLLLITLSFNSYSQENKQTAKWRFRSVNLVGLLQGEDRSAFQVQTINGVEKNNLFGGIGVGLDFYKFKSIPVFIDVRKYFGHSRQQLFVYADPGIHFVWEKEKKLGFGDSKWKPGFYADGGVGYSWRFSGGGGFVMSAGYSYKRVKEVSESTICPFVGPCRTQVETYKYSLNRISIKMGLLF
jgi:hypothetical protein